MVNAAATLMALAAAAPALAAPALAPRADLCDNGAKDAGSYTIMNNLWGTSNKDDPGADGTQCTTVTENSPTNAAWHSTFNWKSGPKSGNPVSYAYSEVPVTTQMLVGDIKSMKTNADWKYTGTYKGDVSYDIFTAADPANPTNKGINADIEIMIWLSTSDRANVHPKGGDKPALASDLTFGDYKMDLFYGEDANAKTYSFVAQTDIPSFNGDVQQYIDYLVKNQKYDAKQKLVRFQFGSEVYSSTGEATFTVNKFAGSVA